MDNVSATEQFTMCDCKQWSSGVWNPWHNVNNLYKFLGQVSASNFGACTVLPRLELPSFQWKKLVQESMSDV